MSHPIYKEEAGQWTGHVWRRKEAPDADTSYYWSISYSGDLSGIVQANQEGESVAPNLVPDSAPYTSEVEAKQALCEELARRGPK
jgi:hypothetical protein